MATSSKRKTSLTLDRSALEDAKKLGINVSAVAERALREAVVEARRVRWVKENEERFKDQAKWHEEHAHPLKSIMSEPGNSTWRN